MVHSTSIVESSRQHIVSRTPWGTRSAEWDRIAAMLPTYVCLRRHARRQPSPLTVASYNRGPDAVASVSGISTTTHKDACPHRPLLTTTPRHKHTHTHTPSLNVASSTIHIFVRQASKQPSRDVWGKENVGPTEEDDPNREEQQALFCCPREMTPGSPWWRTTPQARNAPTDTTQNACAVEQKRPARPHRKQKPRTKQKKRQAGAAHRRKCASGVICAHICAAIRRQAPH